MDAPLTSGSTPSTPKRRACVSCTAGKAKCTPGASPNCCERCARLGKSCTYLDLPQRRRKQRAPVRIEALQAKVDDLMTQLSTLSREKSSGSYDAHPTARSAGAAPSTEPPTRDAVSPIPTTQPMGDLSSSTPSSRVNTDPSTSPGTSTTRSGTNSDGYVDIVDRYILAPEQAEALVAEFKRHHAPLFPFVALGPTDTAEKLRRESSLLFLVVISVPLCSDPPLQRLLGNEIQSLVSSRIIMRAERSLDALQGLLVFSVWHHYFAVPLRHSYLFMMSQLCVALVYDMGLDKGKVTSLAEKRTLLGAYWLSASVSRALRRPPAMKYTRRIEESSQQLVAAGEYQSDKWIRWLVLLEALACRVSDAFNYPDVAHASMQGEIAVLTTANGFIHELELIKTSATADLEAVAEGNPFMLEFDYLESYIREVALHDELWGISEPGSSASFPPSRATMQWRILDSNKACIRRVLAMPESMLLHVPATVHSRLCYVLANFISLSFSIVNNALLFSADKPSSDAQQRAAATVNLPAIIQDLTIKFESAEQGSFFAERHRKNVAMSRFVVELKKLAIAYPRKLQEVLAGVGITTAAAEREDMEDCEVTQEMRRGSRRGQIGLTLGGMPGNLSQDIGPVSERAQGGEEIGIGVNCWAPLDDLQGLDYLDMDWDSILQAFSLPE